MTSIRTIETALKDLVAWKITHSVDSGGRVLETTRWLLKVLKDLHDKLPRRASSLEDLLSRSCGDLFYHPGDSDMRIVYFKEKAGGLFIRRLTVEAINRLLVDDRVLDGMTVSAPSAMVPTEGFRAFTGRNAALLKILLTLAPDEINNTARAYQIVCERLAADIATLETTIQPKCSIIAAIENVLSGKRSTRAAWNHKSNSPDFIWRYPSGEIRRVTKGHKPVPYIPSGADSGAFDWILLDDDIT